MINNKKYIWTEGEDILFDDTLLHSVENNTNEPRVILFLDIPRQFNNIIRKLRFYRSLLLSFLKEIIT
jgi:beta-hydroxylase